MNMRRNLVPTLAAGAVGALVAAQPPAPEAPGTESVAGWEISGEGGFLTMSHQVGPGRIEYNIWGGSHDVPFTEQYRVEAQTALGSCADEEEIAVGDRPAAQRPRLIRTRIERKLAAMDPNCVLRPARNAALIQGFDAAYAALAARFERARTELDTSPDREQADALARMHANMNMDMDTSMAMDMNVVDMGMETNMDADMGMDVDMEAAANAAMQAAEAAANAAEAAAEEAAPPKAPRTGASERP